jgi:hypothetical protein
MLAIAADTRLNLSPDVQATTVFTLQNAQAQPWQLSNWMRQTRLGVWKAGIQG